MLLEILNIFSTSSTVYNKILENCDKLSINLQTNIKDLKHGTKHK